VETNGYASGVALGDGVAFVADWSSVQTVDTSIPTAPQLLAPVAVPGTAVSVALADGWLAVAGGSAGLQIFQVGEEHGATLHAVYDTPGYAAAVSAGAGGVVLADRSGGLYAFTTGFTHQLFLPLAVAP
jgi:hypothetical protein